MILSSSSSSSSSQKMNLISYNLYLLLLLLVLLLHINPIQCQEQDPLHLHGGSILAMSGSNCIAMAVDSRFGSGPQMIHTCPRTVLLLHSKVMVGLVGLEGDVQSLSHEYSVQMENLKWRRFLGFGFGASLSSSSSSQSQSQCQSFKDLSVTPKSASCLMSHLLYQRRNAPYYVESIVVGLEEIKTTSSDDDDDNSNKDNTNKETSSIRYKPFLCAQDVIGAQSKSHAFVCSGVAKKSLYGCAESLWRPNLSPEELVQVCGKAFLSALERDCLSGYGAVLYLMEGGKGIQEIELTCRND
eukprot:CAMPEP_0176487538 /NCGR_PEP_ID=MMETSP0200_2-20121128/6196_1 /TAXON_ID=947934 /ORGANISM="Chaetoceros sp., Strain GSL56" /LENGTH=298 /DNA_ID=CAMNT_0017884395 /DNA_START=50 /DNA_END=946 /DNA_ORIENTATION=-